MYGVWMEGQERMLEVFRAATLDKLAMSELRSLPRLLELNATPVTA